MRGWWTAWLWIVATDRPVDVHPYAAVQDPTRWLRRHSGAYRAAVDRARVWLMPLEVDPDRLRQHGIKGKKKLVELIDAWIRLAQVAPPRERAAILAHLDRIAAVTREDRYHDMLEVDDLTFKQDATSYLRAAYLLDQVDLDTTRYRAEIREIHARLDAHMPARGAHQRYVFATYYEHFGLTEPFPLRAAMQGGLIARRAPASRMTRDDVYALTHEIFAPFDYGDRLDAEPFDDADLRYLRVTLPALVASWSAVGDVDLVAELVSCLRYVRAIDLPAYTDGLGFLLRTQAPDGHWGDYSRDAARIGAWATTYKLELTVAFHPDWNVAVEPSR